MDKHLNSLELLDTFFKTCSKEEIESIFNEVSKMEFEGSTFEEYLENFSSAFEFQFEMCQVVPASTYSFGQAVFSGGKFSQHESITITPTQKQLFLGSISDDIFSDGSDSNMPQAA